MPMKSYESFQAWIDDQSAKNQRVIKGLRSFIKKSAPDLVEAVKWGNGCYMGKNNGVIYLYADTEYVQFGFFNGVVLSDPEKRLEGNANYIRHIKVRSTADIDITYFTKLLSQAVKNEAASPNLPSKKPSPFTGLSNPALGGLAEAKITSLKKLAKYTEKQILALHGVGPASIPTLRKALKAANLAFRVDALPKKKAATIKKAKPKTIATKARTKSRPRVGKTQKKD